MKGVFLLVLFLVAGANSLSCPSGGESGETIKCLSTSLEEHVMIAEHFDDVEVELVVSEWTSIPALATTSDDKNAIEFIVPHLGCGSKRLGMAWVSLRTKNGQIASSPFYLTFLEFHWCAVLDKRSVNTVLDALYASRYAISVLFLFLSFPTMRNITLAAIVIWAVVKGKAMIKW